MDWKKFERNPDRYDYELGKIYSFPHLVFKNKQLKISITKTYMDDFYNCQELDPLSKENKKTIVSRFLDQYPRFLTYDEIKKKKSLNEKIITHIDFHFFLYPLFWY